MKDVSWSNDMLDPDICYLEYDIAMEEGLKVLRGQRFAAAMHFACSHAMEKLVEIRTKVQMYSEMETPDAVGLRAAKGELEAFEKVRNHYAWVPVFFYNEGECILSLPIMLLFLML